MAFIPALPYTISVSPRHRAFPSPSILQEPLLSSWLLGQDETAETNRTSLEDSSPPGSGQSSHLNCSTLTYLFKTWWGQYAKAIRMVTVRGPKVTDFQKPRNVNRIQQNWVPHSGHLCLRHTATPPTLTSNWGFLHETGRSAISAEAISLAPVLNIF